MDNIDKNFEACGWYNLVKVGEKFLGDHSMEISWGSIGSVTIEQAKEMQKALAEAIEYAEAMTIEKEATMSKIT